MASVPATAVRLTVWAVRLALLTSTFASAPRTGMVVVMPIRLMPLSRAAACRLSVPLAPRSMLWPSTMIVSALTVRLVPWAT